MPASYCLVSHAARQPAESSQRNAFPPTQTSKRQAKRGNTEALPVVVQQHNLELRVVARVPASRRLTRGGLQARLCNQPT